MGRLDGKVVFITGAGRGMGRSHAVRLAGEGADVIGMDICGPISSATGPVTTPDDLAETVRAVEALDRRMVSFQANVTDEEALTAGLAEGVAQLGRVDVAGANAGIGVPPHEVAETPAQEWRDMIETNLTGVFLTAKAAIPHLRAHGEGGALIVISSALGLRGMQNVASYIAAKHGVVGLMRSLAIELAPDRIRVNSIHPTNVDTPLIQNENVYKLFRPDLEHPTRDDVSDVFQSLNLLATPWVQPEDVSEAVLYLAGTPVASSPAPATPSTPAGSPSDRSAVSSTAPSPRRGEHAVMGKLEGKVAVITGAARGQGRSHVVRLAQEGADIIAVDLCEQIATVPYQLATPQDLDQTVKEVEALDRRIVASRADVRSISALRDAVRDGVAQLGRLDIVLANAGIPRWARATTPTRPGRTSSTSPQRRLEHAAGGDPGDGRGGRGWRDRHHQLHRRSQGHRRQPRRVHRHHQLDRRAQGDAEHHPLHRGQARGHRHHADPGQRVRQAGDPGQHGAPDRRGHGDDPEPEDLGLFTPDDPDPSREKFAELFETLHPLPVAYVDLSTPRTRSCSSSRTRRATSPASPCPSTPATPSGGRGRPAGPRRELASGGRQGVLPQRSTFAFSPASMRCPVALAFTKLNAVASRPPGASQYSAESPSTLTSTTDGSSGPCGSQASTPLFHSSFFFAGSVTTRACPVSDTHVPPEPTPTLTSGDAAMWVTQSESRSAKNHRSPSNSTSCSAMGRLVSFPSGVVVVRKPKRSPWRSSATLLVSSALMSSSRRATGVLPSLPTPPDPDTAGQKWPLLPRGPSWPQWPSEGVEVAPGAALAEEPADLVLGPRPARVPVPGAELHGPLAGQ